MKKILPLPRRPCMNDLALVYLSSLNLCPSSILSTTLFLSTSLIPRSLSCLKALEWVIFCFFFLLLALYNFYSDFRSEIKFFSKGSFFPDLSIQISSPCYKALISYICAKSLQLCPTLTLWTVSCQAPLSMESSRQEYWSGLPCPPPGANILYFPTNIRFGDYLF